MGSGRFSLSVRIVRSLGSIGSGCSRLSVGIVRSPGSSDVIRPVSTQDHESILPTVTSFNRHDGVTKLKLALVVASFLFRHAHGHQVIDNTRIRTPLKQALYTAYETTLSSWLIRRDYGSRCASRRAKASRPATHRATRHGYAMRHGFLLFKPDLLVAKSSTLEFFYGSIRLPTLRKDT